MSNQELLEMIKNHPRKSESILIFSYQGSLKNEDDLKVIGNNDFSFIHDDEKRILHFINQNKKQIVKQEMFKFSQNQALNLYNYDNKNIRIEPGAIIREGVEIEDGVIILMNATINVGAKIKEHTMIDMGAVIGSRAEIGKNCHIGANAVLAGVLEPLSASPVIIEDNTFIGAGSVVLEGVRVGHNSIVGAMSLVTKDIPPNSIAIGVPAKVIRTNDERTKIKCQNNPLLR